MFKLIKLTLLIITTVSVLTACSNGKYNEPKGATANSPTLQLISKTYKGGFGKKLFVSEEYYASVRDFNVAISTGKVCRKARFLGREAYYPPEGGLGFLRADKEETVKEKRGEFTVFKSEKIKLPVSQVEIFVTFSTSTSGFTNETISEKGTLLIKPRLGVDYQALYLKEHKESESRFALMINRNGKLISAESDVISRADNSYDDFCDKKKKG